jgi:L-alanine-DL-glutamate epimerase-like enolase superfamily enzyme
VAGHEPRSRDGFGAAPTAPGLGITVDPAALGEPFASF